MDKCFDTALYEHFKLCEIFATEADFVPFKNKIIFNRVMLLKALKIFSCFFICKLDILFHPSAEPFHIDGLKIKNYDYLSNLPCPISQIVFATFEHVFRK